MGRVARGITRPIQGELIAWQDPFLTDVVGHDSVGASCPEKRHFGSWGERAKVRPK